MAKKTEKLFTVRDMAYAAIMAVLVTVCSWITVPALVPFTMQTFAVFFGLDFLGGKRGTLAVMVYILMGVVGLPVFSGFSGGAGVLLGATGGYIVGFVLMSALYWLLTALCGRKLWVSVLGLAGGLVVCYLFGTLWYMFVYAGGSEVGLGAALALCVFPFVIPDAAKLAAAIALSRLLGRRINVR